MRLARTCLLLATLALTACGSGQVKNVFPPRASIQQLTLQPDGHWKLQLRVQNFSNVSATYSRIEAKVSVAGQDAGMVTASTNLRIGPESADVLDAELTPSAAARQAVASLTAGNIAYKLAGRIVASDPKGDYTYTFQGDLSPVPGLPGVLR
ncbi:MAG: LEA type 2 family protein [Proteobacteria bacterium]|nr:LEA type 2 family protein [Pseudomonadota bacterium]